MSRISETNQYFSNFTKKDSYIWEEVKVDYDANITKIQNYIREKETDCAVPPPPAVAYLNKNIFPLMKEAMVEMFMRVAEDRCFYNPQSIFNGIDFMSEYLYNLNPLHPERKSIMKTIFDMDWVQNYLEQNPRPYYPLRLIWSEDKAARVIQAYYRGYLVRKRKDVQELRTFWKRYTRPDAKKEELDVKTLEEQNEDSLERKNRSVQ